MTSPSGGCSACNGTPLCDSCVARWIDSSRQEAEESGRSWGSQVVSRSTVAEPKPWPSFDAAEPTSAFRLKAVEHSRHLAGNDSRVQLALARICAGSAGNVYEAWRTARAATAQSRFGTATGHADKGTAAPEPDGTRKGASRRGQSQPIAFGSFFYASTEDAIRAVQSVEKKTALGARLEGDDRRMIEALLMDRHSDL